MNDRHFRLGVTALAACTLAVCGGCTTAEETPSLGGNAEQGQLLLEQYGCGTCHVIPGVRRANGTLGPNLESFARHVYIAGELPNHPDVLARWIQQPSALVPDTLMPDQGVPASQALDMGSYLMSLR
jgi:cytochrome c